MTTVFLLIAAALMFVGLCSAMKRGEGDRPYPVRPAPPRQPIRTSAAPVVYVDPGPIDPDAPWDDPEAVSA